MLSTISVIFGDDGVVVPSQTRMLLDNMRTCVVDRARGTAIAARRAAAAAAERCIIILVVVGKKSHKDFEFTSKPSTEGTSRLSCQRKPA